MQDNISINELVANSIKEGIELGLKAEGNQKKKSILLELAPTIAGVLIAVFSVAATLTTSYFESRDQRQKWETNLKKEREFKKKDQIERLFSEILKEEKSEILSSRIQSLGIYGKEAIPYLSILNNHYYNKKDVGEILESIRNAFRFIYMSEKTYMSKVVFYDFDPSDPKKPIGRTKLEYSDFNGTILERAKFQSCDLEKANFNRSLMSKAEFSNAVLSGANFTGADIKHVKFSNAVLSGANFTGADISGAEFRGAVLKGVIGLGHAKNLDKAHFAGEFLLQVYEDRVQDKGIFKDVPIDTINKLMIMNEDRLLELKNKPELNDRMESCGLKKIIAEFKTKSVLYQNNIQP